MSDGHGGERWPAARRWPSGAIVRWVRPPYRHTLPDREVQEVRAGDLGRVVCDDSPIEFVVTFEAVGAFCPPRDAVELVDLGPTPDDKD
jgi:hypothetical protein